MKVTESQTIAAARPEPNLTDLDAEIDRLKQALRLARECGFADVVEDIRGHVLHEHLPACMTLLCVVDGEARVAVAARYRRLQALTAPVGTAHAHGTRSYGQKLVTA
jgi:hypothetical protein